MNPLFKIKPGKAGAARLEDFSLTGFCRRISKGFRAFSLIELMIAIALLSLIVLGLLSMFTQTQRAFRDSMKQSDVLEAGRITAGFLVRELEQITPSHLDTTVNFSAEVDHAFSDVPLLQEMPGSAGTPRTNIVQRLFFMSKVNQDYIGTGYQVLADYSGGGVGSLYRYSSNTTKFFAPYLFGTFTNIPAGMTKIADGVVHLKLQAYDTNGVVITLSNNVANTSRVWDLKTPDQLNVCFSNNAVPAFLEFELAVLEPHVLERYNAIGGVAPTPANPAQLAYLSNHVGQVHIFRQRIPVRNVDYSAYQ
jgi:prepilin-type N-terminal cleavage/methylation domain-containing protein